MRLKINQLPKNKHTKMVTAVGWTPGNELYSCSEEKIIQKWSVDGEPDSKVCDTDAFVTDFKFLTSFRGGAYTADLFVIGCSDGTFRLMSTSGRLEKSEKAHTGAVTCVAWNFEGTSLLSSGEDGCIKQWSRSGQLRSRLIQAESAIYSVGWSPDNQSFIYTSGRHIIIKSFQVSSKPIKWRAHDSTVLKCDWNVITGLIVSSGEDCRYKIWDEYGVCLYQSRAWDFPITSISWSPNGQYFVCGSFNTLALCDKTGWCHSRSTTNSGSILHIDWTSDSTHIAAAGANGAVCFGQIVERSCEWGHYQVSLHENNHVFVYDILNENMTVGEELEFGTSVIDMSMNYDHLIVCTNDRCYIYHINNLSTPHQFEQKNSVSLILQSEKYFLLVDKIKGICIYDYEGRSKCNPKIPSLHPPFLKAGNITLSSDALAIIDRANPQVIHILDSLTGKALTEPIRHELEVVEIALNQGGLVSERKIFFIDRNRDLYISQIHVKNSLVKLCSMVDTAIWHTYTDMLAVVSDSMLYCYYYPNVVYIDKDLLLSTRSQSDATMLGKNSTCMSFYDSRVCVRRADGAIQYVSVQSYPLLLYKYTSSNQWSKCTRLCRLIREPIAWSILACMSISGQQLDIAEVALAAIDEVDKLQYIQSIKRITSNEGRNAELLLYRRSIDQAENILLQSDLIYRAIALNISVFRFTRALDLALKYKTHVDTVIAYRMRYLSSIDKTENDSRFVKLSAEVPIDWNAINAKIEAELKKEEARGGAYKSSIAYLPDALEVFSKRKAVLIDDASAASPSSFISKVAASTASSAVSSSSNASSAAGVQVTSSALLTDDTMPDDAPAIDL